MKITLGNCSFLNIPNGPLISNAPPGTLNYPDFYASKPDFLPGPFVAYTRTLNVVTRLGGANGIQGLTSVNHFSSSMALFVAKNYSGGTQPNTNGSFRLNFNYDFWVELTLTELQVGIAPWDFGLYFNAPDGGSNLIPFSITGTTGGASAGNFIVTVNSVYSFPQFVSTIGQVLKIRLEYYRSQPSSTRLWVYLNDVLSTKTFCTLYSSNYCNIGFSQEGSVIDQLSFNNFNFGYLNYAVPSTRFGFDVGFKSSPLISLNNHLFPIKK